MPLPAHNMLMMRVVCVCMPVVFRAEGAVDQ